eukprot:302751_1
MSQDSWIDREKSWNDKLRDQSQSDESQEDKPIRLQHLLTLKKVNSVTCFAVGDLMSNLKIINIRTMQWMMKKVLQNNNKTTYSEWCPLEYLEPIIQRRDPKDEGVIDFKTQLLVAIENEKEQCNKCQRCMRDVAFEENTADPSCDICGGRGESYWRNFVTNAKSTFVLFVKNGNQIINMRNVISVIWNTKND